MFSWRWLSASFAFGRVFLSYLVQAALVRLFRNETTPWIQDWLTRRRTKLDQLNAERLYQSIIKLRGVYIKLGQVLSMMSTILPAALSERLKTLQDQVPAQPFEVMRLTFLHSFGVAPEDALEVNPIPLAAASLGQVHVGKLPSGERVAIKILYPGIRQLVTTDLEVILWAIRAYQIFFPFQKLDRIHESLVSLLARETNYYIEAEAMTRMAEHFKNEPAYVFPRVINEWSNRDVLTMTFLDGVKITNTLAVHDLGAEPRWIATLLTQAFYKQVFIDHLVHADPHPGNFLVVHDEQSDELKLGVLDFGAVSKVPDQLVDGLLTILKGLMTSQASEVLNGVRQMGFLTNSVHNPVLERILVRYFQKALTVKDRSPQGLFQIGGDRMRDFVLRELGDTSARDLASAIEYPESWFYIERAAIMLFWLCAQLDPTLDTMQVGVPYIMAELAKQPPPPLEAPARRSIRPPASKAAEVKITIPRHPDAPPSY